MFSIFTPAKPSDRKTETMEELTQKLNDAMKQLRDLLLSLEDREWLYDVIDYCTSHINTFTTQETESKQPAMAPNLDNLPAEATNEPAELTNLDQNLSSVQDPPNPASNPDYHSNAPSPGPVPFCSPPPYQSICLGAMKHKPEIPTLGEMVFDESNLRPGAVDERIVGMLESTMAHEVTMWMGSSDLTIWTNTTSRTAGRGLKIKQRDNKQDKRQSETIEARR